MNATLYSSLTGEVVTPTSPSYTQARQEWNRAIQKYPLAIVYCHTKHDVSNAILWARKNKISIRIRSGGHNYEGYSVGNGVLVIDISKFTGFELDKPRNLLKVFGGVQNKQLYEFISSEGYPFPGGTCPTVGVSGYVLGGGWGYSCRYLGLGCDSLVQLEMIDYEGKLIIANEKCNSDLFWAQRGAGGGNFGVVVSMTFKLPQKVDKITLIELYCPNSSKETQIRFLNIWQKWLAKVDDRITLNASIYNSKGEGLAIYVRGIFYGTTEEANSLLTPFMDIRAFRINLSYLSFLDAMNKIQDDYPSSEQFKSTGRFVDREYSKNEIENIVDLISERPDGSIYAAVSVYALGGKVRAVLSNQTAFYYRDARYIMGIQSVWEKPDYAYSNVIWVKEKFDYLKTVTKGSYINFPYCGLDDYEHAYYGNNAERLEGINRKYDPFNVFSFQQGIKL